jgi:serine phosphatase RsbU (regulator of sigma subunit)
LRVSGQPPADAGGPQPSTHLPLDDEVRRLRSAVSELQILNDLAHSIGSARSSRDVIRKIVGRARRAVGAEEADVKLVTPEDLQPVDPWQTIARDQSVGTADVRSAFDRRLLTGLMLAHRQPVLSNDPCHDPALRGLCRDGTVRSVLLVPLMVKGQLTGVLIACNKQDPGGFTEDDQRLLAIMASQSAQVLEVARLDEQERQFGLMREQLRLARQIQLGLLPRSSPVVQGYQVAGVSIPAEEVGGDYYDFIPLAAGRLGLCLGDVSGKGLPASLLMANLQATLRGQAQVNRRPEDCVTWSNRLLYQCTDPEKFATLFYGILDPQAHEIRYCNAGHERPLLLRAGASDPESLSEGGIVLGVLDDFPYRAGAARLDLGDLLVVYSDGVTDAVNGAEQPFEIARLVAAMRASRDRSAADIVTALVDAVQAHAGVTPQADDITLVVVRREE